MEKDIEKLKSMAEDTITHKKLVMDNCYLMFKYLADNDQLSLGVELLKRGTVHDNSKFNNGEFENLAKILKSRECFINAEAQLSPEEKKAIEAHWKRNKHHPEYYEDSSEMSELDMIEMVCDWFARSLQYGTKFIPFVRERQRNRFHFEENQFKFILKYCKLMEKLYKESIDAE